MSLLPPEISVVFVAAEHDAALHEMMGRLAAQTIRRVMEVVVVVQDSSLATVADQTSMGFHSVHVVACGTEALLGTALGLGAREATAPIVALIEDHCFPEPKWAEMLLRRHADGYAVVGPEIRNANPDSSLSWANFLLTHSGWAHPARAGVVDAVAGDNCSYRRDVLLRIGEELDDLLASGTMLHARLRDGGEQVFLEPEAKLVHITPSRLSSYVQSFFYSARMFAGLSARRCTWTRRLYLAALSPLIASRWVAGIVGRVDHYVGGGRVTRIKLLMLGVVPVCTLGYLAGYLFGLGNAHRYTSDIYFHRTRHLRPGDRSRFGPASVKRA